MAKRAFKNLMAAREKARKEEEEYALKNAERARAKENSNETETYATVASTALENSLVPAIPPKPPAQETMIKIFAGPVFVIDVPDHLFMAESTKPGLLKANCEIYLPHRMDRSAIFHVVSYFKSKIRKEITGAGRWQPHHFARGIKLCRVAAALGMEKVVHHISYRCHYVIIHLKSGFPLDLVAAVENGAEDKDDRFLYAMADRLAYLSVSGILSEDEMAIFARYPKVYAKMMVIKASWKSRPSGGDVQITDGAPSC